MLRSGGDGTRTIGGFFILPNARYFHAISVAYNFPGALMASVDSIAAAPDVLSLSERRLQLYGRQGRPAQAGIIREEAIDSLGEIAPHFGD